MEELIRGWIAKAESDLKTARDEMNTDRPATDTICFHAQQCVEKYLKAYLIFHQTHFSKTHNISKLIKLCSDIIPDFDILTQLNVDKLTIYAVELRYPDDFYFPTVEEARSSIEMATQAKNFIREKLKSEGLELI